jgi:hypothetical protein
VGRWCAPPASNGPTIAAHAPDAAHPWRVLLRGVSDVRAVDGGTAQADPQGTLVTPPPGGTEVTIRHRAAS